MVSKEGRLASHYKKMFFYYYAHSSAWAFHKNGEC